MNAPVSTKACFTIDGDWLCDFARQRVIEGRWDHAVKTLECLEGITLDQIISVLKGDSKLTGDSNSGVDLEPDDAAAYKEELRYQFAGIWNNAGRYMRPYAIVTSWGPDDMKPADVSRKYRWQHSSEYYANDPRTDLVVNLKVEGQDLTHGDILWEEVHNFPLLVIDAYSRINAQAAFEEYQKYHTIEERGYLGGRRYANQLDDLLRTGTTAPPANVPGQPETLRDAKWALESGLGSGAVETSIAMATHARAGVAALFPKMPSDDEIKGMRQVIIDQAGDNWLEVSVDGNTLRIPQAPFENWCLWRGDGAHLAMPWKTVAPSGLKMGGDDPYHTDFMLGAGLELDAMADHNSPLHKALWDLRAKVQEEKLGFKCAVLCGTGVSPVLKVVHPKRNEECKPDEVAVIPNAGPSYVAAANTAGAVITEVGGAMAHLVTVSREKDVKIVRVEGARKLYPEDMHLVVDCAAGDVHVPRQRIDFKMKIMGQIIDVDTLKAGEDE